MGEDEEREATMTFCLVYGLKIIKPLWFISSEHSNILTEKHSWLFFKLKKKCRMDFVSFALSDFSSVDIKT